MQIDILREANAHKHTVVTVTHPDGSESEFIAGRHISDKRLHELAGTIHPDKRKKPKKGDFYVAAKHQS